MANELLLIRSSVLAYSIIQGVLLFFIFATFRQGSRQAKWLIAFLSLLSAVLLAEDYVGKVIGYERYPHLIFAFSPFWYMIGPLLFFYIRLYVKAKKVRWYDVWHFTPVLIVFIDTFSFYQLPGEIKLAYLQGVEKGNISPVHNLNYVIFSIQCITYLGVSWLLIRERIRETSARGELLWLSQLILTLGLLFFQSILSVFVFNNQAIAGWTTNLYYIAITIFLFTLFLRSIKSPKTLYLIGRPLSFKPSITEGTLDDFQKIEGYLYENKPYLDPEYDIQNLASTLGYSKHHIKNLLKEYAQLSFRDYLNQFRIEEAKEKLNSPQSKLFTIEFIATESGFASQATFYRVFKKTQGQTPKSFITN